MLQLYFIWSYSVIMSYTVECSIHILICSDTLYMYCIGIGRRVIMSHVTYYGSNPSSHHPIILAACSYKLVSRSTGKKIFKF